MGRITFRSLWEHKRRLLSTMVAVVLGVAFMAGTFVFADTLNKVFDDLFADVNEEIDVQVQGNELFDGGFGGSDGRDALPLALRDTIAGVDGVVEVEPFIQSIGFGSTNRVFDSEGEPMGASQGPPTLLESWSESDMNPYKIADGRGPTADNEVALNVAALDDSGYDLGDQIEVLSQLGRKSYTIVGSFTFGTAESATGATSVDFTLAEAQRIAGLDGQTQEFIVKGDGTITDEELKARVAAAVGDAGEVLTGAERAAQTASDVQSGFSFFSQILTVFAGVALLVGTFIISNTFSILVAQRTRELALLRAIGATRRQVLTSVLVEAGVIGVLAAAFGLLGGIGLAKLVTAALAGAGADLPTTTLVVSSNTVITAFVLGFGITVLAAILPAIRATRVPPLAALREVALDRSGTSKVRMGVGVLLLVLAAFGLSASWSGNDDSLPTVGMGAVSLIMAAIVLGPVLAEPTVRFLGAGLPRLKGITGVLATENAARSPKRTSATASALLIGVALIGFISIFASSARASIVDTVERGFNADLVVQADQGFGPPGGFAPSVADTVAAVPGVAEISSFGFATAQFTYPDGDTATQFLQSIDPATINDVFEPTMIEGAVADLSPTGIIVDTSIATDNQLAIGDQVTVTGLTGKSVSLTIEGISDDMALLGPWSLDNVTLGNIVAERQLAQIGIVVESGADVAKVQDAVKEATAGVPSLSVLDRDGFIGDLTSQITSFLTIVQALLGLSVIIAVIGIANTLSLSIHERTRELGLLRAVGMTRSQLRSAVRWEAVIISVLGTLVGLAIGLICSYALVKALGSFGLSTFSLPVAQLVFVVIIAAFLGVLASIRPARRAARLEILDAIATS